MADFNPIYEIFKTLISVSAIIFGIAIATHNRICDLYWKQENLNKIDKIKKKHLYGIFFLFITIASSLIGGLITTYISQANCIIEILLIYTIILFIISLGYLGNPFIILVNEVTDHENRFLIIIAIGLAIPIILFILNFIPW